MNEKKSIFNILWGTITTANQFCHILACVWNHTTIWQQNLKTSPIFGKGKGVKLNLESWIFFKLYYHIYIMCIADDAYIKQKQKIQLSPFFSFSSIRSHEWSVNSFNMAAVHLDGVSQLYPTHFQNVIRTLSDARHVDMLYNPQQTCLFTTVSR